MTLIVHVAFHRSLEPEGFPLSIFQILKNYR